MERIVVVSRVQGGLWGGVESNRGWSVGLLDFLPRGGCGTVEPGLSFGASLKDATQRSSVEGSCESDTVHEVILGGSQDVA